MINSVLFGNGYWANIVKGKIDGLTNLLLVVDSRTDLRLLSECDIDVAFVCSSTSSHYEVVKWCIDAGVKSIFCEKPFTGDYKKATELLFLATSSGVAIFIDNVFLGRNEIAGFKHQHIRTLDFVWNCPSGVRNENLYDDLLYHDLYLLLKLSGVDQWEVKSGYVSNESLRLELGCCHRACTFVYNRNSPVREKLVVVDNGIVVDLSTPVNDPLHEYIVDFLQGNIDFVDNHDITLRSLNLLDDIKRFLR
jgi:hypothetical protein